MSAPPSMDAPPNAPPEVGTAEGPLVEDVAVSPSARIVVVSGTVDVVAVDGLEVTVEPSVAIVVVVVGATVAVGATVVVVTQPSGACNALVSVNSRCPLGR